MAGIRQGHDHALQQAGAQARVGVEIQVRVEVHVVGQSRERGGSRNGHGGFSHAADHDLETVFLRGRNDPQCAGDAAAFHHLDVDTTSGSALVELQFEATIFRFNTFFIGSMGNSAFENSWQRVDDGDANGVVDSETTVVLALERGELLGDLQVDRVFTPNGDGVNDELEVSFSLLRVLSSAPVQVAVYDLSGRLVTRIAEETITAGRHTVAWTGVDQSRAIVPPGIYLMRIDLDVDSTSKKNTSVHRLVHVAY